MSGYAFAISSDDHPLAVVESNPQMLNSGETRVVRLSLLQIELGRRYCQVEHWSQGYLRKPYTKLNCELANQLKDALMSLNCSYSAIVKAGQGQNYSSTLCTCYKVMAIIGYPFQTTMKTNTPVCPKMFFVMILHRVGYANVNN